MKQLVNSMWFVLTASGFFIGVFALIMTWNEVGPVVACSLAFAWVCVGLVAGCVSKRTEDNLGLLGFVVLILSVLSLYPAFVLANANLHRSHKDPNMQAWHIYMPGIETHSSPENTVYLDDWSGSHVTPGWTAVDKTNDEMLHEAGKAVLALGIYEGYKLKRDANGTWVLYKPYTEWKEFDWSAPYRVSRWAVVTN